MTRSMTGYARRETETGQGVLSCELRSVNHRYLDTQFRLPELLRPLEPALRERIGARLGRGKLDIGIRLERGPGLAQALEIDESVAEGVSRVIDELQRRLPEAGPVGVGELLAWPGLVRRPEPDVEALAPSVEQLFDEALEELIANREREGGRIRDMLLERCQGIEAVVAEVRRHLPEVRDAIRDRTLRRLEALEIEHDGQRLEQELALLAQKLDVDEELDRLEAHVAEVRDVLRRDEPVGRRLDFLMQEFNREANTLGSKSQDSRTTAASVELKVLVEQMREQIQNLE
jgi:uncharacterized protein (TIGR00255 family)